MSFVRVAPSVAPGRTRRLARRRPESNPHHQLGKSVALHRRDLRIG